MINSVALKNWKSHDEVNLKFKEGVNILVGNMGSGKSSILQAISFGLFGTFSELKSRDVTIPELVSRSAVQNNSEIELSIKSPKDRLLKIKRKINGERNNTEGVIRNSDGKLLSGPQTTQTNEFIKNELETDEDVFLRTVYAVQNDIDMILKMSPKQRKKKIDELMGLDRFDTARDNCVTLRNKINRKRKESESFLESIEVENLSQNINEIKNHIESMKSKQLEIRSDLKGKEKLRGEMKKELEKMRLGLENLSKLEERKRGLLRQLNKISEKLANKNLDKSQKEIESSISNIKSNIKNFQIEKTELSEKVESEKNLFSSVDKKLALIKSKNSDLKQKLERVDKINKELSDMKIKNLNQELSDVKNELEDKKDIRKVNRLELKALRDRLQKLSESDSNCPVCNSELSSGKKENLITETKSKISGLIYKNTELAEIISKFENRYDELNTIFEKNRRYLDELSNEEKLRTEFSQGCSTFKDKEKVASDLTEKIKQRSKKSRELEERISKLNSELNELSESRYFYELKEQKKDLKKELDLLDEEIKKITVSREDVDKKEKTFQNLLENIQRLRTNMENFGDLLREKTRRLSELNSQKERVNKIENKIENYEKESIFLNKFKRGLEATQLALRDELILAVNEVMSQIWIEIYPYEKWSGIRLASKDNDYSLQMKESDGGWVSVVGLASGGERMLAALAVRIAFARVLAPSLSLLILDEPTNNLDHDAVETFIDVIQNKVSDFLDQIIIVTHEEKLAENSDNVIRM